MWCLWIEKEALKPCLCYIWENFKFVFSVLSCSRLNWSVSQQAKVIYTHTFLWTTKFAYYPLYEINHLWICIMNLQCILRNDEV